MTTHIPIRSQVEQLRDNVGVFVAETPLGPVIVWSDTEGDWHSTRVLNEDEPIPVVPAPFGFQWATPAGIDPYDPGSLEDVTAIVWADGDSHALADVAAERRTHHGRGWTAQHDRDMPAPVDRLVRLAEGYAHRGGGPEGEGYYFRADLVKAAALLLAAIDTLDRAEADRG